MIEVENLFALGQDFLARQPFSQLLEAELLEFEKGRAVLRVPIRPDSLQQHGFVHGGLISYLADNALTFAGGSIYGDAVTSEFKINYLRPGTGKALIATAKVEYAGRSQAVVHCVVEAIADSAKTVAIAQGTITRK
jgi:uncharacterized protein (TIGR00369 family)